MLLFGVAVQAGESEFGRRKCQEFADKKIWKVQCESDNCNNMAKSRKPKSLAEQIADLDDPAPKGKSQFLPNMATILINIQDFDPEDVGLYHGSESENSESEEETEENTARAHYEPVG
jgi:hypothetical protein